MSDGGEAFASDIRIVLSTAPDAATAARLARMLVEERLAACVTAIPGARSTFRWHDAVEESDEIQLVIKTTAGAAAALAARLEEAHPYDVPEVIALEPVAGAASYFAWIVDEVRSIPT